MKLQLMKCPLCNETLLPTKHNNGVYVHEYQTTCAFELSEIQIEVLRDAALGRAVRKMKAGMSLWCHGSSAWGFDRTYVDTVCTDGPTPEAALQVAGLMEVEG